MKKARGRTGIKVLLAFRGELFRRGVVEILGQSPNVVEVGEATWPDAAIQLVQTRHYDVVICRPDRGNMRPSELAQRLARPDGTSVPLLILARDMEPVDIIDAMRGGVAAYLSTDTAPSDLITSIMAVQAGLTVLGTQASRVVRERLRTAFPSIGEIEASHPLTAREREVLDLVAEGRSNKEISVQLGISQRTVEMHVGHIMDKLGCRSRTELIVMLSRSAER